MKLPLEKLQAFCKKEGIAYMAVFGSVANGTDRSDSDIDFVVSFIEEGKVGLLHFIGIKNQLEDLLGRRVDLVSRNALNPKLKKTILSNLVEVYKHAA